MRDEIIKNFETNFPTIAEEAVGYRVDRKYNELIITLQNGNKVLYDGFTHIFRNLPDINDLSDRDVKNEFGRRLRRIMDRKHITQGELSELTDIKQGQISLYISGKVVPTFATADKIARALGCSMDEFRYLEE